MTLSSKGCLGSKLMAVWVPGMQVSIYHRTVVKGLVFPPVTRTMIVHARNRLTDHYTIVTGHTKLWCVKYAKSFQSCSVGWTRISLYCGKSPQRTAMLDSISSSNFTHQILQISSKSTPGFDAFSAKNIKARLYIFYACLFICQVFLL